MITVELTKDDRRVKFMVGPEGLTRASGKGKRMPKKAVIPTQDPNEAMAHLAKGVREELNQGYVLATLDGITSDHLETLVAQHAPSPKTEEFVTLALANDATRDQADGLIPGLSAALGLRFAAQSNQVTDPTEPEGQYTLLTMHSGCARKGTQTEVFLAALAWRFKRPLVHGDAVIDPRVILDRVSPDIRDALATMGCAPGVLQLDTATAGLDLVW